MFTETEQQRISAFRQELEAVILGHEFREQAFTKWVASYYEHPGIEKEESEEEPDREDD